MRRVYQFDGVHDGVLSIIECPEPGQICICIECAEGKAHIRLSRDEWDELMRLNYNKINFVYEKEEETEKKLQAV